jgi:hypothetical protein
MRSTTGGNRHQPAQPDNSVAARIVVAACAVSAGIHAGLVPEHLHEAPRVGVAFVLATGLLLAAAAALAVRPGSLGAARGAALLLASLLAFYAASRTTGLPLLEPHAEPLDAVGATTKLVEVLGLVSALRLIRPAGDSRSPMTQEVAR